MRMLDVSSIDADNDVLSIKFRMVIELKGYYIFLDIFCLLSVLCLIGFKGNLEVF